jgi:hypothetical protein
MPYTSKWVNPKLFLTHKGVKVYHIYKDDDCENNGPRDNYFTTDREDGSDSENNFDVRELSTWVEPAHPPFLNGGHDTPSNQQAWDEYHENNVYAKAVKKAIKAAIDKGDKLDGLGDDEFKCDGCGTVFDIEDSVKKGKKEPMYCPSCAGNHKS